jgi:hypothetical protein
MFKFRIVGGRAIGAIAVAMLLGGCGSAGHNVLSGSSPAVSDPRLVIADQVDPTALNFSAAEVRLLKLDSTVAVSVKGQYVGMVGATVIVLEGESLKALDRSGSVRQLGTVAGQAGWAAGTVLVKPDLTQWIYVIHDADWTARVHLGTPTSDTVVATLRAPGVSSTYSPFAWNASGIYMVRQDIGLGGAGPFLEYQERLARFDLTRGTVADVSPDCRVYRVLDDGTMFCRPLSSPGRIEVRSPSGHSSLIQLSRGASGYSNDTAYIRVTVSDDGKRLMAGRNGSSDPMINYQIVTADLATSSVNAFATLDYLPDTWLPSGRVVADHWCAQGFGNTGACDASLNGTYVLSADGASHSLLFKLAGTAAVVGSV